MKKMFFITLFFLVTFFVSAQSLPDQPDHDTTRWRLNVAIDKWHRDAADGNHDDYIGAMTGDGVFIGTDATERWTTAEFSVWSKPYFDRKKTWNFARHYEQRCSTCASNCYLE